MRFPTFRLAADTASYEPEHAALSLAPPPPAPPPHEYGPESGVWQMGVGYEYFRFRSAPFNANLSGLHTSLTYFRNNWLGFEGNVVAAFGTSTLNNESSKLALYTGGPHLAWRGRTWQPWGHALVGGIHVFPQTASGINGFAFQVGGGVDYRFKPLISLRVESDYVRSQLYSSGQNSFQIGAGLLFHF